MNENREEKGGSVFLNFLAGMGLGALVGAVAALLVAPKSGDETREDIKHATEDFRNKANKMVHELSESSEELVKKSKELLEATRGKVQNAVEAGKQAVTSCREHSTEESEKSED
ncbi:MAG: YtxH domain-containing protein [Armatimonadota bacterium]|nr:YtxH domain-containing protein [bacterium]